MVAINAQYHDYAKLFEEWFGGNIDNKVFESAITFWFKDVDFDGDKVCCLLYTSPSPRDRQKSRMPSSA